ncbi:DUF402 domain-containing protein [Deinococcus hopiensis]|uniref:DUF402 domain-containing protein n=1 Tax=Deinococcus hopiensis KR-140 TaxID=695939 RepID=A0A1W1VUG5_9DEIO|nr:DUF402 domain-containing protein [Deinococcus hopiensis]SMB97017.1 hypothetical protein SAMN00790413_06293 [Deinococcus hopiensis KR-140]
MHPARVETLNLTDLTHTLDYATGTPPVTYRLDWAHLSPTGLHVARAFHQHPDITHMERHVLPEYGLLINRYTGTGWAAQNLYYVDVAAITPGDTTWVTRDLYLDLTVSENGTAEIEDTDEYLGAIREGLLTPDEAEHALTSLHRLTNGMLQHGTLNRWLESLGVTLTWRGPTAFQTQ